jgi:hypothetical protein
MDDNLDPSYDLFIAKKERGLTYEVAGVLEDGHLARGHSHPPEHKKAFFTVET